MRTVVMGRPVKDLALPDDKDLILDYMFRAAVKRDNQMTWQEIIAWNCTMQWLIYGRCVSYGCPFCGGF